MARKLATVARRRTAARITNIVAVAALSAVVSLAVPADSMAQTSGAPPIKIPPARLPPLAAAPTSAPEAPTRLQPAPRALLPTHVQVLHDPQSAGIAVYGALTGKAASAVGVVLAIFANSEAFDPTPAVQLIAADEGDRHAQALFTASVKGAPVIGIAVAALSEASGDVTVFYDAADAFAASFPRMREALARSDGVGTIALSPIRLGDGNAISIPAGWEVTAEGTGSVTLQGRQGEIMSLGATMPVYAGAVGPGAQLLQAACCDPVAAFAALYPQIAAAAQRNGFEPREPGNILDSQPAAIPGGGNSALILSSVRIGGDDYAYLALAETVPGFTDPWTFKLSGVIAPHANFSVELPIFLQIWKSYGAARPSFDDGVWQAVREMNATHQMLDSTIGARETPEYNADPGWDQLIEATAKGGTIDMSPARSLIERIAGDTNRPWRIVPPAEWK